MPATANTLPIYLDYLAELQGQLRKMYKQR